MSAQALTTVRVTREARMAATMSGETHVFGVDLEFAVTYVPGKEDEAIAEASAAYSELVAKIDQTRPASGSTQEEGHTK